ncbi:MAG: N-acetyltransferase [Eubacteriaceae bacterium]|nr:N-acetyltransferase [Eubacteriaceae bacterium]
MDMITVRSASADDAPRLLEIYTYYVKYTAVSFEYDVPSEEEFASRIENTLKKYPYLVLEDDGVIMGYAYAGVFKARAAYERSCELSVYVDKDFRRKGYGRMLYEELEKELSSRGFLNLYACIGDPIEEDCYLTRDSEKFHSRMCFTKVGTFHSCGYKFGRWYNMIWMEKLIGEHADLTKEEKNREAKA